jgi:hypothetical protein
MAQDPFDGLGKHGGIGQGLAILSCSAFLGGRFPLFGFFRQEALEFRQFRPQRFLDFGRRCLGFYLGGNQQSD